MKLKMMSLKLALLLLLPLSCILCSGLEVRQVTLDNKEVCTASKSKTGSNIYWASEKKAILVIGRSRDHADSTECSIIVGAATTESSRLQLSFEAFHIRDCGVVLSVNQSSTSDFQADNTAMAKIGCNHGKIRVLHAEEKHFVRIRVQKSDLRLLGYNFRINITVTEYSHVDKLGHVGKNRLDPLSDLQRPQIQYLESNYSEHSPNRIYDKLETTGVELHVVVIVGLVTVVVVAVSLWLLIKYLIRRTQRWQEQCTERNMERAIRLYNNQETPQESNYMYTALPPPLLSSRTNGQEQQNPQNKKSSQSRMGNITFVHSDGHIETFIMRENPEERHSGNSERALPVAPLRPVFRPRSSAGDPDAETLNGDEHVVEDDMNGECPPSYEEALHMPAPQDHHSALYVNLDSKKDDNHTT